MAQGQARVLGEGKQDLLFAGVELAARIPRADREAAGYLATLPERGRDRSADAVGREVEGQAGVIGAAHPVGDDQPALAHRPSAEAFADGRAPVLRQDVLVGSDRRDQHRVALVVVVAQAQADGVRPDDLLQALDHRGEDLVRGLAIDDRALKPGEALEQRLALAQRGEQALVLAGVAIGLHSRGPLAVQQAQRPQPQPQRPCHASQQVGLDPVERLAGAPDDDLKQLLLDRDGGSVALADAIDLDGLPAALGHRGQLSRAGAGRPEPDCGDRLAGPEKGRDLGVENLGDPLDAPVDRGRLVLEGGDQLDELGELLRRPAPGRNGRGRTLRTVLGAHQWSVRADH